MIKPPAVVRTNLGPIRMDVNAAWDLASHDVAMVDCWLGTEPVTATAQPPFSSRSAGRSSLVR